MNNHFIDIPLTLVESKSGDYALLDNTDMRILVIATEEIVAQLEIFLGKVVAAVGFEGGKDAVWTDEAIPFHEIIRRKHIRGVLIFGYTPADLSLQIEYMKYQSLTMRGIHLLFADTVTSIMEDQNLKKELWACLREMYGAA